MNLIAMAACLESRGSEFELWQWWSSDSSTPKLLRAASSEIEYLLEAPVDLINAQKTALTFALPSIKSDPTVSFYGDRFWKDSRPSVSCVPIFPIDFHARFVRFRGSAL